MSEKLGKHIVRWRDGSANENLFLVVLHRAMGGWMERQAEYTLKDELINLIACGKWDWEWIMESVNVPAESFANLKRRE